MADFLLHKGQTLEVIDKELYAAAPSNAESKSNNRKILLHI